MNFTDYLDFTPEQVKALTSEQYAEYHRQQMEQLDLDRKRQESLQRSTPSDFEMIDLLTAPPDALRENMERELQKDILSAIATSRNPQAALAQIARYNSIPIDVVMAMAQKLSADVLNRDLEQVEFDDMTRQIQNIEAKTKDPGFRELKLTRLAKRHGLTLRSMMECFNKSLCSLSAIKALPIGEFLKQHLTDDVKYLVNGWIPQGITMMIHGEGGTGKTLLLYEFIERVLKGCPWSGYPCRKSEVLLVQVDEPEIITAERIDIRGISPDMPLKVMSDWQVEQMTALEREAAQLPRESLIVIDSITAINRNCFYSENDTEYARPILQIRDLARKFGHTVILVHHSNSMGNPRGTKAIHNSVDVVWGLSTTDQGDGDRLLRIQKMRRGMPMGRYKLAFDDETYQFTYQGQEFESEEDFEKARNHSEKIRLWLSDDEQRGRVFEPIEVSEALGIPGASTRKLLRSLLDTGAIEGKRKPGTPYYLYFVKKKQKSDPAIPSDPFKAIPNKPLPPKDQKPSDPSDPYFRENLTFENSEKRDRWIASTPLIERNDDIQPIRTSDPSVAESDQGCDPSIAFRYTPLQENPAVGDTVLVVGTAEWIRSGSDKLPWKEVPPSMRNASKIPINVMGLPLFDELMEGGKVIEMMKGGDRVKIRSKTGRTSVWAIEHIRVLRNPPGR